MFVVSRGGNLSTDSSVRGQKHFKSGLRKFQRFTGSLQAGTLGLGGVVREGRCCNRGNFCRTRLSGSGLSWPTLVKARSGLVPTFRRREEKLAAPLGRTVKAGLKPMQPMQLHSAPRHGGWAGCSFLSDTPCVQELQ